MRRTVRLSTTAGLLCALAGAAVPAASAATSNETSQATPSAEDKADRPYCALQIEYPNQWDLRIPPNCQWPETPRTLDQIY